MGETRCEVIIYPGEEVATVVRDLIVKNHLDICLCLQPGGHKFSIPLPIGIEGLRLQISGCGRGTRLVLAESFRAILLAAVTLRNIDIVVMQGKRIEFDQCIEVTLDSCHISSADVPKTVATTGALCFIQGANRIVLYNNVIKSLDGEKKPDIAIVIDDGRADTRIENNDILGIISLYGLTDGSVLNAADMKNIAPIHGESRVTLLPLSGILHFRNNRVTRVTVGGEMLENIRAFKPNAENLILKGVYMTGCLTDNIFETGGNTLVMRHVAMTANDFDIKHINPNIERIDAGAVIADSSIYLGNHAPNDIRLFNLSRLTEKAANLTINIVDI